MKLEILAVGSPKFPRFIIANDQGDVFDGTSFTNDRDQAILYAEDQAVALQHNILQEAMFKGCPLQEFVVPLNIRVRAAGRYTKEELEECLERMVSIIIDQEKAASPFQESMVQLDVTWRAMQEKGPAKADHNQPRG